MDGLTSLTPAPGVTPQAPAVPQPEVTADSAAPGATPAKPQEAERKPVNLFEVPEFRNFQAAVIAPMQRELQELRSFRKQAETANLDPEEKLRYDYNELQRQYEEERAERARLQTETQKERDLAMLFQEFGAPREVLESSQTYEEARLRAEVWKNKREIEQLRRGVQAQADDGPRYQAPQVELGGSRPPTTRQQWENQVQEARQRGDTTAYYRLMMQQPD